MRLFILFLLFLFVSIPSAHAIYDPLSVPNNKFGIHVVDPNDLTDVANLVNSTNGDWGYVTFVIPDSDRSISKWQSIFDQMRRLHLIPIIRLATHTEGSSWVKPSEHDAGVWVDFLSKFNWPVENRYIILFNEPNHAKEWGNTINPEEYAGIAIAFARKLKDSSSDYYILPAGLDASASTNGDSMDEEEFLRRIYTAKPEYFTLIDGWTSHSYPNPAFSGSPFAYGKGTINGFRWERDVLYQIGVRKQYQIFITETGWLHSEGKIFNRNLLNPDIVGTYLIHVSQSGWTDQNIVAITPFLFNYQDEPFDHFSWKKYQSSEYYSQYYSYQSIQKTKGNPRQRENFRLLRSLIPDSLVTNASYTLQTQIVNNGQSIMDEKNGYELLLDTGTLQATVFAEPLPYLEPKQQGEIILHIKIPAKLGSYSISLSLKNKHGILPLESKQISIIPPPRATLYAQLGWKRISDSKNITVLLYDIHTQALLETFQDVVMINGKIQIPAIQSVIPETRYRIVALIPSYLPRQAITVLHKDSTDIVLKRFLPLDFDRDGAFTLHDLYTLLFQKPVAIMQIFFSFSL